MLRKLTYIFLIVFFGISSFAVYSFTAGLSKTADVVAAPFGALARQLAFEATPVILPDPVTIVNQVNTLAFLETASMSMEKIVTASDNEDQLFGLFKDELIFVAYGEVVAGVNLAEMNADDMQVIDPVTVMVHIPDAEIAHHYIDEQRSYVADRDTPLLARVFDTSDPEMETLVRRRAEQEIFNAAIEADIVGIAQQNAEDYMEQFLMNLGFENIIFTDETPPPAPPFIQDVPKGSILLTPAP